MWGDAGEKEWEHEKESKKKKEKKEKNKNREEILRNLKNAVSESKKNQRKIKKRTAKQWDKK